MARIVSLGSALEDIYLIDRDDFGSIEFENRSMFKTLELGSKFDIDKMRFFIGGGGTNSAVTFARAGHEVIYLGNLGHDPAGEAVLERLDKEGVDTSYISYPPRGKTGCSVILLDSKSGERTILTFRGSSAKFDNLSPKDLEYINPDWLYITTLRGDLGTLTNFLSTAKRLGTKVMFNPGVLELANPALLKKTFNDLDILLLNRREASSLVPGDSLEDLLKNLRKLVPTVLLTAGNDGGIATDGKKVYRFGIYDTVKIKDTTGAGDAFGSGFLASFASGKSFKSSLVFASANSTSTVQHLGTKDGLLPLSTKLHPMPIQEQLQEQL
ncbi:carbohydrate kinase family protein [Candidatus Saccharibacteria bacterium]|nr:carbohydrate kinase family protein [Candidatus Saccharibacteria bacterium]